MAGPTPPTSPPPLTQPIRHKACSPSGPAPATGRRPNSALRRIAASASKGLAGVSSQRPLGPATPTVEDFAQRPQTHCGSVHRSPPRVGASQGAGDCLGSPREEETSPGASALELVAGCRLCMKLRLRLENEERARVKAQEQLLGLHSENLRLKSQLRTVRATAP